MLYLWRRLLQQQTKFSSTSSSFPPTSQNSLKKMAENSQYHFLVMNIMKCASYCYCFVTSDFLMLLVYDQPSSPWISYNWMKERPRKVLNLRRPDLKWQIGVFRGGLRLSGIGCFAFVSVDEFSKKWHFRSKLMLILKFHRLLFVLKIY